MAARRASQLLRVGVGSAALASIPAMAYGFAPFKVEAAEDAGEARMVKISQLPLYVNPEDKAEVTFEPESVSALRQGVSEVRQATWGFMDSISETTDKISNTIAIGKAHTEGFIDYLQNDPGILPRATVITVAGLGGIVAGYKGGPVRKMFFSATGIGAATSLCYPNEAVAVTSEAYNLVYNSVMGLFVQEETKEGSAPAVSSPAAAEETVAVVERAVEETAARSAVVGDHGQSRQEDKDMYSTRS